MANEVDLSPYDETHIAIHPHGKVRCHIAYKWNPTWTIFGADATILYWGQPCVLYATSKGRLHTISKSELNDRKSHRPIVEENY